MDHIGYRRLVTRVRPVHWVWLDYGAAAVFAVPALLLLANHASGGWGVLTPLVGVVTFVGPIAGRRHHPVLALFALLTGLAVVGLLDTSAMAVGLLPLAFVLYTVAEAGRPRIAFMALVCSLAAAVATTLPEFEHRGAAVLFGSLYVVTFMLGYSVGVHRRHTRELLGYQARLTAAEVAQGKQDLVEERVRIARELHDIVAHGMSVITVQAAYGGLVLDDEPETARSALVAIESTGRQTMTELRRLLTVLRQDHLGEDGAARPALSPQPGLEDLERLVAETSRAGVDVALTKSGEPTGVSDVVALSAYRIVQEALTNTVKHAQTTSARVHVQFQADTVRIEVSDDGAARVGSDVVPGHGIVGMRERARLCGGALSAGPKPGGGFEVTCVLPVSEYPVHRSGPVRVDRQA